MKKQLGRDWDGHSEWPMLESTFECIEGQSAEASEPEGKRWEIAEGLEFQGGKTFSAIFNFRSFSNFDSNSEMQNASLFLGVVSFQPLHTRVYQLFSVVICGKDRRNDKISSKAAVSETELLIVFFLPKLHSQMR